MSGKCVAVMKGVIAEHIIKYNSSDFSLNLAFLLEFPLTDFFVPLIEKGTANNLSFKLVNSLV